MKAKSPQTAGRLAEFYTSDITDISTDKAMKEHKFKIEEIRCGINESLDVMKI